MQEKTKIPPVTRTYKVEKGLIHLTEDVNPKDFRIN